MADYAIVRVDRDEPLATVALHRAEHLKGMTNRERLHTPCKVSFPRQAYSAFLARRAPAHAGCCS